MRSRVLFLPIVLLFAAAAEAGKKPAPPEPTLDPVTEQSQLQAQGQLQGQVQGQDQQQAAIAGAGATSSSAAEASSVAKGGAGGAGGYSGGNSLSTAYESRDRALALALPGQTAAPAVAGECLEHTRGGSGLSIGVSGRTRINRECMEFVQCVALADRYAAWGQLQLAVEQLERCGGVPAPASINTAQSLAADDRPVTREEVHRMFREALAK